MIEKEIQDYYIEVLIANNIPFIHIPNSAFKKGKIKMKYDSFGESCLKNHPDVDFQYNGIRYQREFGIRGQHKDRKKTQKEKMKLYAKHGTNVAVLLSMSAAEADLREIGLIK